MRIVRAIGDAELREVVGVDLGPRRSLALPARRHLVEGRVEVAARGRCREPERDAPRRPLSFTSQWSGSCGTPAAMPQSCLRPDRNVRPVRLEAEFAVRVGEAVRVVRRREVRLAVDPLLRLEFGERAPAGFAAASQSMISRGVIRSRDAGRRRASPGAQMTSWLERHSPGGSISFGPSRMCWCPPP